MLVDLGPVQKKKKGLVDLGPAPTPITEAMKALEAPLTGQDVPEEYRRMGVKEYRPPTIADPQDLPATPVTQAVREFPRPFDPAEAPTVERPVVPPTKEPVGFGILTPPRQTLADKLKTFIASRADPIEKIHRAFGAPMNTAMKYIIGRALGTPEVGWAIVKKVVPEGTIPEDVQKMPLGDAMAWAAGYSPSGFTKAVGNIAEFVGGIQTAARIGKTTGITPAEIPRRILPKAWETAKIWGISKAGREFSNLLAKHIDPKTDYQYEGARGVVEDMGIGAGFSLAINVVATPALAKLAETPVGKKIVNSGNRTLIELSKRFPELMDKVRKNPRTYFMKNTLRFLKQQGVSQKGMTPKQKALLKHVAREHGRRFTKAYANYIKHPAPDIVYAKRPPKVPARITGEIRPPEAPITAEARQAAAAAEMDAELAEIQKPARIKPVEPTVAPPVEKVAPEAPTIPPEAVTEGKVETFQSLIGEAEKYESAVDYQKLNKLKGHPLDKIPKGTPTIKVASSLFQKEVSAFQPTGDNIAYHDRPPTKLDTFWDKKIKNGARPPVLVGVKNKQLRVVDGNHRLNAYLKNDIKEIPVILTKDAQEALARPAAKPEAKVAKPKLVDLGPAKEKEFEIEPGKFYTQAKIDEAITKGEMGEIEIEPTLETESKSFNKHIDYFQKRQLPETSQIRKIQKQMQVVNGQRLAGTITAKDANKKIQQLRKLLFETAEKEGIALRMTKGGKVSVAVRKAGTYVPVEFAEYGKFQNVRPLGEDVTRSIQQIDGALPIKEKVRMKGQAGATERHVLWPTREISKQKLEYIKEKSVQLKKVFKTKAGTKEDAQINIVLEKIAKADRNKPIKDVLSAKTIKAMAVQPSVVKQAVELRKFYDDLIEEQNIARRIRGQEEIPYRHNYSPHILRDTTIWERLMMRGQKPEQVFGKKADLPDYIKPNKPFNPREMAREAGIPYEKRVKSATELAQSYLVTASKDIFNTSIIQNNKAFIQQLEAMGYDKPARYLGDWTAEAYAGIAPAFDRSLQLTQLPKAQRGMRWFNQIRNLAVFPLNFSWNLLTQTSSLALTVGRYGTVNTTKGFYQWLHPSIRKQAAEDYYSYIVKSAKQGRITRQDAQNLIGETVKLRRTKTELARDISTYFLEQLEKLLTGTSIRAAHLHGSKRGLTGEALKNYASDGGAKTQSMYNDEDKPGLLRSVLVKTGAPYQTFAYEVMNTLKEWAGKTGTPPDTKLYTVWTILRFLAAATVFATIAKKGANKDVWSWKRPPIPFAEFWLSPIIKYFTGQWISSASGLTSPIETAGRFAKGLKDVIETDNWRKLRNELIKYGPGVIGIPGGVQWSRTVDAIIAYSQGGVRDRRGRLLFKMEDPQDLVQAMFSGVWTTKGGREYIERRTRKKEEGARPKTFEREQESTRKKRFEREKKMLRK